MTINYLIYSWQIILCTNGMYRPDTAEWSGVEPRWFTACRYLCPPFWSIITFNSFKSPLWAAWCRRSTTLSFSSDPSLAWPENSRLKNLFTVVLGRLFPDAWWETGGDGGGGGAGGGDVITLCVPGFDYYMWQISKHTPNQCINKYYVAQSLKTLTCTYNYIASVLCPLRYWLNQPHVKKIAFD